VLESIDTGEQSIRVVCEDEFRPKTSGSIRISGSSQQQSYLVSSLLVPKEPHLFKRAFSMTPSSKLS
jgi:hypothetical protein